MAPHAGMDMEKKAVPKAPPAATERALGEALPLKGGV